MDVFGTNGWKESMLAVSLSFAVAYPCQGLRSLAFIAPVCYTAFSFFGEEKSDLRTSVARVRQ
jgi:hypothetical protein